MPTCIIAAKLRAFAASCLFLAIPGAQHGVIRSVQEASIDQPDPELVVEAEVTIEERNYQPMEPIWVRFEVINETDQTWVLFSKNIYRFLTIEVKKDGEPVSLTAFGKDATDVLRHLNSDDSQFIRPGGSYFANTHSPWVLVNRVRDMTVPGEYEIKLSLPFSYDGEEINGIYVYKGGVARANPLTVTVSGHPRPPDDR